MKLSTPRWWYVRKGGPGRVTRALLTPLSWLWTAATRRRLARGPRLEIGCPVVSVGNLTVGGSGKTPVVAALRALLVAQGVQPTVLSRGYGGRLTGPVRVDPVIHGPEDVGDEPLMLARDGPVVIARDRAEGARLAVDQGAPLILMDDGHQNPALKTALALIVVDGETRQDEWPFGDGRVFPAGPLREPLAEGLARADAVILLLPADLESPDPELLAVFGALPVLTARLVPAAAPPPGPQVGFAGIAKPWKVERALKAAGCDLKEFAAFPDHAAFSAQDLDLLARLAETHEAGLVTTEKDWVRLPPAWRERVVPWPVQARFDDPQAVRTLLDQSRR